ncbi:MAG: TonB-dependent receptor [Bacteroidales bacterium]|nr:TonB-dependent receptor [Bacteroidales bacterium]MBK7626639.1 TonB-dependent receptor [Bacteroidales bacterium]
MIRVVTFLFCFSFYNVVYGSANQQDQDTILSRNLSEVVISANRFGSIRLNTPEAVRVTGTNTVIRQQLRSAPEALVSASGVFVQKTNHGGGSPFLRGLTGNQTLLLIDGIRLNNSTYRYGPNQYFNTIDLFSIEKIEVLRGSGSVQYGSDALGGAVNVFTHDVRFSGNPSWGSTLYTRLAAAGMEQSLNGSLKFSSSRVAVRGGLTLRNFGDLKGGDTTGVQSPTGYSEIDYDIKGKLLLSESTELTMFLQSVHQSNVPVFHKVVLENYAVNRMDPQNRKLGYVKVTHKPDDGLIRSLSFSASWHDTEEGRESRKNNSDVLRYENDKVRTLGFIAEAFTSDGNNWSASTGAEIYNDLVGSTRYERDLTSGIITDKRGLYPDNSRMTSIAAFSLHTIEFQNWIFSGGARFNAFLINVHDEVLGETSLTPSALVGNFAIMRKLTGRSSLFVSANSGFRAPNVDDLGTLGIVDFRYETPNFNLTPEHSLQFQTGYKYQGKTLRGEIFIYRNELRNLIVRNIVAGDTIDGYPVYIKENVERAFIRGVETAWELDLGKSWNAGFSLTYTYGQNITKNEPVRRIPPLFGRVSTEYSLKNLRIGAEWLAAAKQERLAAGDKSDNRIPAGGTPAWSIFNLNAGYDIDLLSIGFSLQNILNEDYRYHGSGVNGQGRTALISLMINLGSL